MARFLIYNDEDGFMAEVEADNRFQVIGLFTKAWEGAGFQPFMKKWGPDENLEDIDNGYVIDCATDQRFEIVNGSMDHQDTTSSMLKSMVKDGDPEWRCTRPGYYQADCPGRTNPRSRQGHYIRAPTEEVARLVMNRDYPGEKIDVERWKN